MRDKRLAQEKKGIMPRRRQHEVPDVTILPRGVTGIAGGKGGMTRPICRFKGTDAPGRCAKGEQPTRLSRAGNSLVVQLWHAICPSGMMVG